MHIAVIGTGNVGGALATQWSKKGHHIHLGVQDTSRFKGTALLNNARTSVHTITEAAALSEVILVATPPPAVAGITKQMGDVTGKVIIDATNSISSHPGPCRTVYEYLANHTKAHIVKCFNTTGFENLLQPEYHGEGIDMFMAGSSDMAKDIAVQLALDCGFENCYDFGGADKVELLEQFALAWINLAIFQGHGRNMAIRIIKR